MSSADEDLIQQILSEGWANKHTQYGPCEGYVYVVRTSGEAQNHVKIGFSKSDPRRRISSIQTGNHRHLKIMTFFAGCRSTERALHVACAKHRASGEWFRYTDEVRDIIEKFVEQNG